MHVTSSQRTMIDAHRDRLARMEARAWVPPAPQPVDNPVSEPILAEKAAETAPWPDLAPILTAAAVEAAALGPPGMQDIIRAAAARYRVKPVDILSQRRTANVVRPRQVVMYLARHLTRLSLPQIGRALGGRDHTTALHGCGRIASLLLVDENLREDIAAIKATLGVVEEEA